MGISSSTKRRHEKAKALFARWVGVTDGTPVIVRRANGETLETITESEAWYVRGGAYIRVRGIPGNTRLSRVSLADTKAGT